MKIDLKGNVKSVGNTYLAVAKGVRSRRLVQSTVTVEDESPWRRGEGRGVLLLPHTVVTIGRWREALIPTGLTPIDIEGLGEIDEDVAEPAQIKEWIDARSTRRKYGLRSSA